MRASAIVMTEKHSGQDHNINYQLTICSHNNNNVDYQLMICSHNNNNVDY